MSQPPLDPARAALIVIDMQNGFCSRDGSVARIGLDVDALVGAVEPCRRLVEAARAAGLPVIHTRYVYAAGHSDGGLLVDLLMPALRAEKALLSGSWDAETVPELAPIAGELVIDKNRPSAFFKTGLEDHLAEREIDQLIVCGVTTNCCVESTVRDASQRDIATFVVADATAELDRQRHDGALATIAILFGWVVDSQSILASLERDRAA